MFEHLRQELYQEQTKKKRQSHRQAETDNISWHVETVKEKIILPDSKDFWRENTVGQQNNKDT